MMSNHLKFINLAHDIALKNLGKTFPNPSVGCIVSKNNKIISRGVTSSTGRPHAEEIALKKAGKKSKGATMYVTLEPCFHSSQNGSCTDQILRSGIKEVYVSCIDQDPRTKNKSISNITYAQKKATENIFKKKKIPFRSFEIKKRDEKTLGELFCFFMLETILLSKALKVNPYDQPAVETIKKETRSILI